MPLALVLASMSIGWPLASSLSGRLYMRFGLRQTALRCADVSPRRRALAGTLPRSVDNVIGALQQQRLPASGQAYLRMAIDAATIHLYVTGLVVAVLVVWAVSWIPRHFAQVS